MDQTAAEKKPEQKVEGEVLKKAPTPTVDDFLKKCPQMMSELTQTFVTDREYTERANARIRMKAILDFISIDTQYPSIPKETRSDDFGGGLGVVHPRGNGLPEPARMNEDILGGAGAGV